jgi:hypothetical protein
MGGRILDFSLKQVVTVSGVGAGWGFYKLGRGTWSVAQRGWYKPVYVDDLVDPKYIFLKVEVVNQGGSQLRDCSHK